MAIRRIYETPDPVLRQISKPVETFDDELKTLVADMFETMYAAPGIGLQDSDRLSLQHAVEILLVSSSCVVKRGLSTRRSWCPSQAREAL